MIHMSPEGNVFGSVTRYAVSPWMEMTGEKKKELFPDIIVIVKPLLILILCEGIERGIQRQMNGRQNEWKSGIEVISINMLQL